jgi:hypothetical protein
MATPDGEDGRLREQAEIDREVAISKAALLGQRVNERNVPAGEHDTRANEREQLADRSSIVKPISRAGGD